MVLMVMYLAGWIFFSAHLFSCRVQVSRPKEGAALRREAEAAGAREVSQREDGQGARGCGRRRGRGRCVYSGGPLLNRMFEVLKG